MDKRPGKIELRYSCCSSLPGTPPCITATNSAWATIRVVHRNGVRHEQWSGTPCDFRRNPDPVCASVESVYGYRQVTVAGKWPTDVLLHTVRNSSRHVASTTAGGSALRMPEVENRGCASGDREDPSAGAAQPERRTAGRSTAVRFIPRRLSPTIRRHQRIVLRRMAIAG